MKKFELTSEFKIDLSGRKLFRIKALIDIERYGVKACYLGGWVEKEDNLSQTGDANVFGNADYTTIKGFGTVYRTTTFFKCQDGAVRVTCGSFYGTIDEFREQIKRTREGKVADEYLKIADLMEYHFKKED
jgi:hypothetical protein